MTTPLDPGDGLVEDLVGPRVLAGVQLINISRLSTHPVPITPRGLITVAGQGPSDSNGAGKSSFIAGLSLLHADDQWRLQSGAQAAAELLFTAELAGQEAVHANADRGYLIGVFLPPDSATVQQFEAAALTVWLRISRQSPHVELRWAPRLHVAYGDTENERAGGADDLWTALPNSGGRRSDIKANRLARTLYGSTVRCVSFLSTSVRASLTANLLAQPLNELTPERIFEAVGALTGLNREIELEQTARTEEHRQAQAAAIAQRDFDLWDERMSVVERGIAAREAARTVLAEARDNWRSRCARSLVDGVDENDNITHQVAENERAGKELEAKVETADSEVERLRDDKAFEQSIRDRTEAYRRLKNETDELTSEHQRNIGSLETHAERVSGLRDQAVSADGRTVAEAEAEVSAAEALRRAAERIKGRSEDALRQAHTALTAAERGEDVAGRQVAALRENGIAAAPLVDVISLTEPQRPVWEARLLPYRHAAVVAPADLPAAVNTLASLPGSLLIEADPAGTTPDPRLPTGTEPHLPISGFLSLLRDRAGDTNEHLDAAAGVYGIAGFPDTLTGRAGRIRAARIAYDLAAEGDRAADDQIETAKHSRERAGQHLTGARAAAEAATIEQEITRLRRRNTAIEDDLRRLAEPLRQATEAYDLVRSSAGRLGGMVA